MNKFDGRKLDHKTREAIRKRAVQRIMGGESPEVVAKTLGYHRSAIYQWLKRHADGGMDGLDYRKIPGAPSKLSPAQQKKIFDIVTMKKPEQLKFPFALWTLAMVRQLIAERFDVTLSEVSVGRLLKKLGLTPQKPLRRAWQQDPVKVDKWLTQEYPAIQKEAKKVGATVYFGDEAGVRSDYHSGATWAIKGQTPIIRTTGSRFGLNMISAVSAKGRMRFMTVNGRMNTGQFMEFLDRLIRNETHPVFLIVDGHPVHRAKKIQDYVASTQGKLKLFFLPPYSPELNPDEQVWSHLKHHRLGKMVIKNKEELITKTHAALRSIQRTSSLVMSFFRHKECCYTVA